MTTPIDVHVPDLDIDALMLQRYGRRLRPEQRLERRIVAALCAHLAAQGWTPSQVSYGEEPETVTDAKSAMEWIFNLDDSWLCFSKTVMVGDVHHHSVFFVCGNGVDIISDWNYAKGDADGFNAAMEAFTNTVEQIEVR